MTETGWKCQSLIAMDMSMANGTLQQFHSPNGSPVRRPGGLQSPERSGSPDLQRISSQRGEYQRAYTLKEVAHQHDDWPGSEIRKSEDVIVRYKNMRTICASNGKSLHKRTDRHAWSDLATETEEEAEKAPPFDIVDWSLLKQIEADGYGLDSSNSHESSDKEQIERSVVRVQGQGREISGNGRAKSPDISALAATISALSEQPINITQDKSKHLSDDVHGAEEICTSRQNHITCTACHPDNLIGGSRRSLDEQGTLRMSRRYFAIDTESSRGRNSPPINAADRGKEKRSFSRKLKMKGEMIFNTVNSSRGATGEVHKVQDVVERLAGRSQELLGNQGKFPVCKQEETQQGLRQMILEKYLIVKRGKVRNPISRLKVSAEIKQNEKLQNLQAISFPKTFEALERKFTRSNLYQTWPFGQRSQGAQKKICHEEVPKLGQAPLTETSQTNLPKTSTATIEFPQAKSMDDCFQLKDDDQNQEKALCCSGYLLKEQETRSYNSETPSAEVSIATAEEGANQPHDETQPHASCHELHDPDAPEDSAYMRRMQTLRTISTTHVQNSDLARADRVENQSVGHMVIPEARNKSPLKEKTYSLHALYNCPPETTLENHKSPSKQWTEGRQIGLGATEMHGHSEEEQDSAHEAAQNGRCVRSSTNLSISVATPRLTVAEKGFGEEGKAKSRVQNEVEKIELPQHRNESKVDEDSTALSNTKFLELIKKVTAAVPFEPRENDEILPALSLAVQPAFIKVSELQKKVEELKHHVADERRQRQAVARRLTEERREAEKLAKQKQEHWDFKFQDFQKEKQALSVLIQELEAQKPSNKLKSDPGVKLQLTAEELQRLRQELLEQETLIRGYQLENERAVIKIKEVEMEAKEKLRVMSDRNAVLAAQLANRHLQGGRQSRDYDSASVLMKEKLQGALSRELALRVELDKVNEAHVDLLKRVAEGDSSKVKDMEMKLTALQETLAEERHGHACTVSTMEGKLQTIMNQEELLASLQTVIDNQVVSSQEVNMQTPSQEQREGMHINVATDKKENLQNQVKRLEASLKAGNKEARVPAVGQVSKPGYKIRQLKAELVAIQRHIHQRDEETNNILHHMKIESDKLRHESAVRIRQLKQQLQAQAQTEAPISENEISSTSRINDLKKQVANMRIQYSREMKELSEQLEEAKPEGFGQYTLKTDSSSVQSKKPKSRYPAKDKERLVLQEDILSQKDQIIRSLQQKIRELGVAGNGMARNAKRGKHEAALSKVPNHKLQKEQQQFQESDIAPSNGSCQGIHSSDSVEAAEVTTLRKELEKSEIAREMLQKACSESVEKTVLLTLQYQQALQLQHIQQSKMRHNVDYQQSLTRWIDSKGVTEGLHWVKEDGTLERANRALEARLKGMSEELEEHAECKQSPRMAQIMVLKTKVAEMEARQHQKEMDWRNMVQETKRVCSMEEDPSDHKRQQALNAKNSKVQKFQHEFNAILEAAVAMQQSHMKTQLS